MPSLIHRYLSEDHERLDALLRRCLTEEPIPLDAYEEFRRGLLRHIGIEERILFPLLRGARGATPLEDQLHRDHAALAALLVPPPTRVEIERIASILSTHNVLEEEDGGMYEIVEALGADELFERIKAMPEVPTAPYSDTPLLRETIAELLKRRR